MNEEKLKDYVVKMIEDRGVKLSEIAELTFELQEPYVPGLKMDECIVSVEAVLNKREVQNAVITGIELDICAEKGHLSPLLTEKLMHDEPLYGIDEILALSIVNVYGSIGFTNFGYVDKLKPGIIRKIDNAGKKEGVCHTYLDDIVGAIAAAAASRIAHNVGGRS